MIIDAISDLLPDLESQLVARYVLTKYLLLFIVREIIERENLADRVLGQPQEFVRSEENRQKFKNCIHNILNDVIIDLNHEIGEYGDDFDYRDKLRDAKWVREISHKIVGDYQKLVRRNRITSFEEEWKAQELVGNA